MTSVGKNINKFCLNGIGRANYKDILYEG
jgi:hypothetical protein